jgi:hypothetical protein
MDPVIKELVIKHIDNFLTEEKLLEKVSIFKECQKRGLVSSIENAIYGALLCARADPSDIVNILDSIQRTSGCILPHNDPQDEPEESGDSPQ